MNTAKHISDEDLALFALALMPPEEAASALAHLKDCELCRSEVARIQGDLATYALTAEMHDAPATSRTRLLDAVAREKRSIAHEAAEAPTLAPRSQEIPNRGRSHVEPARRGIGFFGWFGWAVAAGLAAVSVWQFHQTEGLQNQLGTQSVALDSAQRLNGELRHSQIKLTRDQEILETLTDPAALQIALHLPSTPGAAPKPEGHASYNSATGHLVFIGTHLQPISPGKTYELWLLPASGTSPVPAGLFRPNRNGSASVMLPRLPKNIAAKGFGVTIENEGGAAVPTPPIVLAGTQS